MTVPKKIAFYVRVSTTSQDFPSQLHAMREWCRRHGWKPPAKEKIFAEKITGKLSRRTQLDVLLQQCRDGHVDTILCYRLDRVGNSFLHLVNLIAEFDRLKIRVVGVADGMDTAEDSATMNHFRRTMMSAAAYNRELIVERTIDGLKAARARGRKGGAPRKNDVAIAEARKLMAKKTLSLRSVAKKVGLEPGYLSRELKK